MWGKIEENAEYTQLTPDTPFRLKPRRIYGAYGTAAEPPHRLEHRARGTSKPTVPQPVANGEVHLEMQTQMHLHFNSN